MITFRRWLPLALFIAATFSSALTPGASAAEGNRLTYLEESNPFYVHLTFPKLTTPQWVGEGEVEAVVILAIDDMRDTPKYETFLRPILDRLKQIDGRAPLSILCNALTPTNAQLQAWLQEGLSLDVHTLSHPCPCLAKNSFTAAADTYHGGVDLLNHVPGNEPVAYRMPCCDSMNSPSPRFYAEIFNRTNAAGQFLSIDSSVMNILTPRDKSLPRDLVLDADGREKFRKYLPTETNAVTRLSMRSFVTTIEDYPYPYVIGRLCWEFPAMVPSDWEAQNVHGSSNPITVADWKAALDATVLKQGTFSFIFHPHGWIRSDQMVEFIDYAVQKYGKKVKFLSFREAQQRLDRHLLAGQPLRASTGQDNGARLLDVNNDGFLDVVIGNEQVRRTRVWNPRQRSWTETSFPTSIAEVRFGVLHSDGRATILKAARTGNRSTAGAWYFEGGKWSEDKSLLEGLSLGGEPVLITEDGRDRGVRLRDVDRDGRCEWIVGNEQQNAVFAWYPRDKTWKKLAYALPPGASIVNGQGEDNGLRFVDLNEDGFDDVLFSNPEAYGVHLFLPKPKLDWAFEIGWTCPVRSGRRGDANEIPMIVRGGPYRNNGAWFHSRHLWIQNEDTAHLPDKVDRRSFEQLLAFEAPPPQSPQQSLESIRVRPGFKVELVAHEPLVQDPIAFEWGADGKLWVVEMGDYPVGTDGKGKAGGIVRFLEDTNDDGRYDKSTVFLSGLNFPTGVMPWRKGVLVSAAPDIFYAEDTDGDGQADLRTTLFTGFGEGNQQHRVNGFDYGLDNWVYGANGDSGGLIKGAKVAGQTSPPVNLRGHDFRFRPDTGAFETIEGQTQFGRHRDDWGNWFGNNNPAWLWHYWVPERYLARNPSLAVRSTKQSLANSPNGTRLFALSRPMQRFNWPDMINILTSANSPTPYRDDLFGPDFAASVFISEPANNLVHREVLKPDGVTFTSHRAADEQDREFLASTDNWFRPTMLKTGPDGALYIADMYRLVIEHIEYALPGMEKQIDLRAGADQGRIYRVYPEGATLRKVPRLDRLAPAGLVAALDSPNGWQRDTVQRLIVHADDKAAVTPLNELVTGSKIPQARLQALCTLEGLGSLTPNIIMAALKDDHPAVREHAVRISESLLRTAGPNAFDLGVAVLRLLDDREDRVRYQLALSLGEWDNPRAGTALGKLALKDLGNARIQTALMSSAPRHVEEMLAVITAAPSSRPEHARLIEQLTGLSTALLQENVLTTTLGQVVNRRGGEANSSRFAALAGFLATLERRNTSFQKFKAESGANLKALLGRVEGVFTEARQTATDSAAPESERQLAIKILGFPQPQADAALKQLGGLLQPQNPVSIQSGALSALKTSKEKRAADILLEGWRHYSPNQRVEVLSLLFSRLEWLPSLLREIEQERIPVGQINAAQQQNLLAHSQASIRERAARLFAATRADRRAVLKEFQEVPRLKGDRARGAALFGQHCAACHKFNHEGISLGPDLAGLTDKSASTLLVAILDPNRSVEAPFVNYTIVMKNGRELSGIITGETLNSVTLRTAGGSEEVILRQELSELTSSGLSLMPEGFEKSLPPQSLADLIEFIGTPAAKP